VEYCRIRFRAPEVDALIEPFVMMALGDKYWPEMIDLLAEDHTGELAQVEQAITDPETDRYERGLFKGDAGAERYALMMGRLEVKAEALRAAPKLPPRRELVLSDETFSEKWEALETDRERGALLRRMRVRLYAYTDAQGRARLQLHQLGAEGTRRVPRSEGDYEPEQ
jgi:hypothetical protein